MLEQTHRRIHNPHAVRPQRVDNVAHRDGVQKVIATRRLDEHLAIHVVHKLGGKLVHQPHNVEQIKALLQRFAGQLIVDQVQVELEARICTHVAVRAAVRQRDGRQIVERLGQIVFNVVFEDKVVVAQRHRIQMNERRHFVGRGRRVDAISGRRRCELGVVVHVGVNEEPEVVFDVRTAADERGRSEQVVDVGVVVGTGVRIVNGGEKANGMRWRWAGALEANINVCIFLLNK